MESEWQMRVISEFKGGQSMHLRAYRWDDSASIMHFHYGAATHCKGEGDSSPSVAFMSPHEREEERSFHRDEERKSAYDVNHCWWIL
jgi:hypothetical protein